MKKKDFEDIADKEIRSFHFASFTDDEIEQGVVKNFKIKEFHHLRQEDEKVRQKKIKIERELAHKKSFNLSPMVRSLRGIKDLENREFEERVAKTVALRLKEVEQEAFEKGRQDGQELGRREIYEKMEQAVVDQLAVLQSMVERAQEREKKLIEDQVNEVHELLKTLSQWVILRELENDGEYLRRLLEKLILELQTKVNLVVRVNEKHFSQMPDIIQQIEEKLGSLTNLRVEKFTHSEKPGIILESENGILDGSLETQMETLSKMFREVMTHDES